jgi:hypothetical protein
MERNIKIRKQINELEMKRIKTNRKLILENINKVDKLLAN